MDRSDSDATIRPGDHTAFVLGNGPSLASVSLPALSDYATIGMNAAYRYWHQIDWRPRYYACVDVVVGLSHKEEIRTLINEGRIEKFLLRDNLLDALADTIDYSRVVNFDAARVDEPLLAMNPPTTGSHSALWAGSMGYKDIVMLGIDIQYKEIVDGATHRDGIELEIVEERENPNYFFKGYQMPGDRYNIPNPRPDLHLEAWRHAGTYLARAGVKVFNANENSGVRCFPFIKLPDLLAGGALPSEREGPLPRPEDIQQIRDQYMLETGKGRMIAFLKKYGLAVGIIVITFGLGFAALMIEMAASWPEWLLLGGLLGFVLIGAVIGLYSRDNIIMHLRRQDEVISGLRAKIADIQRRK